MVTVFDDLVADPTEEHRRLLQFAGLRSAPLPTMKAERQSKGVRFLLLQQLLKRPPRALLPYLASIRHRGRFDRAAGEKAVKTARGGPPSLRRRILQWNRVAEAKRPIPLAVQREIAAQLQGEVDKLGSLIGRDLSHWLQPRA